MKHNDSITVPFVLGTPRAIGQVRAGDWCFLACYATWMVRTILFNYTFVEGDPFGVAQILAGMFIGFAILSVLLKGSSLYSGPWPLVTIALAIVSFVFSRSAVVLVTLVMAYLSSGTRTKQIAYCAFIVSVLLIVLIGVFSLGFNIAEYQSGFSYSRVRLSLGFSNPNVMGALAFQACAAYFYLRWDQYSFKDALFLLLWLVMIYLTVYSRTTLIGLLLLIVLKPLAVSSVHSPRVAASIPLIVTIACLVFAIVYASSNPVMAALDEILSYRFTLASRFISAVGFSPFGTEVPFGGVWMNGRILSGYLDNAYVHLFLQSGIVVGLVITFLVSRACYILWKKDFPLMVTMLSFIIYGISEQYIFNVAFSFVCVALFFDFGKQGKREVGNV